MLSCISGRVSSESSLFPDGDVPDDSDYFPLFVDNWEDEDDLLARLFRADEELYNATKRVRPEVRCPYDVKFNNT